MTTTHVNHRTYYQPLGGTTRYGSRPALPLAAVPTEEHVDWIAVERVVNGDTLPLNEVERYQAARLLHRAGLSAKKIAPRVGASERTVNRWIEARFPARRVTRTGRLGLPLKEAA